ncbi:MAG TPA: tetratricopeptide repeat protein [Candidatus Acidoferrales bacterium]|nr:tetratricopeptide repeat protein [Candidatus Acidoferrales bacterium]
MESQLPVKFALLIVALALAGTEERPLWPQMASQSSGPVAASNPVATPPRPEQIMAAIAKARGQVQEHPSDAAAWAKLGKSLQLGGNPLEAGEAYDKAVSLDPRLAEAWSGKGELAAQQEKWWLAAADYSKVVTDAPHNDSAHFLLGQMLLQVGDFSRADQEFKTVLNRSPHLCCFCAGPDKKTDCGSAALFAYAGLGQVLMQKGDLAGAEKMFREALARNSSYPQALIGEGQILLRKNQPAKAAKDFEAVLRLQPDSLPATNGLATALRQSGKTHRAENEFNKARELFRLQQSRLQAEEKNNRGLELWHHGDLSAAAQTFRRALDDAPDYAMAHNNLGSVLYLMGDAEGASREFSAAVADRPGYALAYDNWGIVLLGQGDVEGAIKRFTAAIAAAPGDANAHLNLALALEREGKDKRAESQLRLAVELAPQMAKPHVELGLLLASREGTLSPEARQQIGQGLQLDPGLKKILPPKISAEFN